MLCKRGVCVTRTHHHDTHLSRSAHSIRPLCNLGFAFVVHGSPPPKRRPLANSEQQPAPGRAGPSARKCLSSGPPARPPHSGRPLRLSAVKSLICAPRPLPVPAGWVRGPAGRRARIPADAPAGAGFPRGRASAAGGGGRQDRGEADQHPRGQGLGRPSTILHEYTNTRVH